MHKVLVGISFEHPDKGFLSHLPGETVDLTGWPQADVARFEAEGIVERLPDPPAEPVKPGRGKATPAEPPDALAPEGES